MTSIRRYLLHQAVFRLHFPVKCLLPIWPIDHSMLMDYAIFPIFTLMRTWSLVSSLNFYFYINPALQMIILINKALIEHLLRVWIRTQSLVRVKCFQSDRNQTFKTCSSSLQLLHLQHPPHCHISFHLSFHPLGTRSICYRTHAQSALFAHPNKQLFITLGLPFAPCCILHI